MDNLLFQPVRTSDIPHVLEVLNDATQYKLTKQDSSWGDGCWYDHEIQVRMDNGNTFYLAKYGDRMVGTVSLGWNDVRNWGERIDDAGYMHQLAIKDGFHGQGMGEQVVNWVADEVAKNGRQFLRLDCDTNNQGLCKYYEGLGFVRVGGKDRQDKEMGTYVAALYELDITHKKLAL